MRYIGLDPYRNTVVQIDGNKSQYINVRSFGATGLDRYFTGSVSGVNSSGTSIYFNGISDFYEYENDYFIVGRRITAFFYENTSTPTESLYNFIFTNPNSTPVGAIHDGTGAAGSEVKYFVYPFNPQTGVLSPYASEITQNNIVSDPDTTFDEQNYIQFTLQRSSSQFLPLIFRRYNGVLKFLGIPGNNAVGTGSTITFQDRGAVQIASWDEDYVAGNSRFFIPDFLSDQISYSANDAGPTIKVVTGKRTLEIKYKNEITGALELVDAFNNQADLSPLFGGSTTVKFKFDDTKAIQDAIDYGKDFIIKDIFFPSGIYNVGLVKLYNENGTNDAYDGISLRGVGTSSIIKRSPSYLNAPDKYGVVGIMGNPSDRVTGISFSNLAFDGNKTETFATKSPANDIYGISSKYQDLLALEHIDLLTIDNCSFYNGAGTGIYSIDSEKLNLTNCKIFQMSKPYEPNVPPLKIRETDKVIAQGNLFENCTGVADFTGIDVSVINNNIINNCGDTGLLLRASDNWNATGNLTFNASGSVIQSVDLYQNDYSRASIAIKRGTVMAPYYFTVTEGQLPVDIAVGTLEAKVYALNANYTIPSVSDGDETTYLHVIESTDQLRAGIFGVTAPVNNIAAGDNTTLSGDSNAGHAILGTENYKLIDVDGSNPHYGYSYRITAKVRLGDFPIKQIQAVSSSQIKIFFETTSDFLKFLFFAGGGGSNDKFITFGVADSNNDLSAWTDKNVEYTVLDSTAADSTITINIPSTVSDAFPNGNETLVTRGASLKIVRQDYFIADGNVYVSD